MRKYSSKANRVDRVSSKRVGIETFCTQAAQEISRDSSRESLVLSIYHESGSHEPDFLLPTESDNNDLVASPAVKLLPEPELLVVSPSQTPPLYDIPRSRRSDEIIIR